MEIKAGDIISFGESTGHVECVGSDHYIVNAYVTGDMQANDFHINRFRVPKQSRNLKVVSDQTADDFRRGLCECGYQIWVDHSLADTTSGLDWCWKYEENGIGVFLCLECDYPGGTIKYLGFDGYEIIRGSFCIWRHFIRDAKNGEARIGEMKLSVNGLQVDSINGRLVKFKKRAEIGEVYWYITDRFSVRTARDMRTPVHDERYNVLNYFLTPNDAKDAIRYLTNHLKPNITED